MAHEHDDPMYQTEAEWQRGKEWLAERIAQRERDENIRQTKLVYGVIVWIASLLALAAHWWGLKMMFWDHNWLAGLGVFLVGVPIHKWTGRMIRIMREM